MLNWPNFISDIFRRSTRFNSHLQKVLNYSRSIQDQYYIHGSTLWPLIPDGISSCLRSSVREQVYLLFLHSNSQVSLEKQERPPGLYQESHEKLKCHDEHKLCLVLLDDATLYGTSEDRVSFWSWLKTSKYIQLSLLSFTQSLPTASARRSCLRSMTCPTACYYLDA